MKWDIIFIILNAAILTSASDHEEQKFSSSPIRIIRQEPVPPQPNKTCNSSTEDDTDYDSANPKNVWICKNSQWIPYQLSLSFGSSKQLSGQSCKHIRDVSTNDCLPSKLYWVQEIEVYCEMDNKLDGGGWTLVWQHSYMEDLPLTTNMTYFSNYYKPCTQHATSWCNIPNKARFNPTEQMIVAYLNKQVIYAYKGVFNRNIDYDWSGGYLLAYARIIDNCSYNQGRQPSPVKSIPGIAFSKYISSCNYQGTGGTIKGSLTNPSSDRWAYCRGRYGQTNEQMTLVIYVR